MGNVALTHRFRFLLPIFFSGLNTVYTKDFFGKAWQIQSFVIYLVLFSLPILAGMFSTLNPCEPAFISWQFLTCNSTKWAPSTTEERNIILISGFIETMFWYQVIGAGVLANMVMFYLPLSLKTCMARAAK